MLTFEESTVSSIARLGTPSACKKAFNVCFAPDSYLYFDPREGKADTATPTEPGLQTNPHLEVS